MRLKIVVFLLSCVISVAQVAVVNGASGRLDQPVSPGSWAFIKDFSSTGADILPGVPETIAPGYPASFPKQLSGVTIKVAGLDAAIWYVSKSQVNFLIPFAVPLGVQPVVVTFASGQLNLSVRVMAMAPGLFPLDVATPPRGAILNFRNGNLAGINDQSNPAHRGETIQIYATGPGPLSGTLEDGVPVPPSPLITAASSPQVFIGGVEASVQGNAMAPTLVGVWIINVTVPDQPFISGRVPIIVYVNGVDSNEVTVFVQ